MQSKRRRPCWAELQSCPKICQEDAPEAVLDHHWKYIAPPRKGVAQSRSQRDEFWRPAYLPIEIAMLFAQESRRWRRSHLKLQFVLWFGSCCSAENSSLSVREKQVK